MVDMLQGACISQLLLGDGEQDPPSRFFRSFTPRDAVNWAVQMTNAYSLKCLLNKLNLTTSIHNCASHFG